MVFTAKGERLTLRHADGRVESLTAESPFAALRDLLRALHARGRTGSPPVPGWRGRYISYDMVRHVEELPRLAKDDLRLPDAVFMFTDSLLVFDTCAIACSSSAMPTSPSATPPGSTVPTTKQ